MATVSSSQQRRNDGGSWEHRSNRSEDYRQNFSLPKPYGSQSPPQSPMSPEEFVTPNSSHFPQAETEAQGDYRTAYNRYDNAAGVLSDRPINQQDAQRQPSVTDGSKYSNQAFDIQQPKMRQSSQSDIRGNRSASGSRPAKKWIREKDRDDSSNWVHREKLIALEIQDHIDRGEKVPQALLDAHAASSSRYTMDQRQLRHDLTENNLQRHTVTSPVVQDVEYDDDEEEFVPEDPRTPEEIAAETRELEQARSMYHSPTLRSSSSRIPVSKGSPYPVPQEHLDRAVPLPRKRSASIGLEGDDPMFYQRMRSRSQSVGSQVMVDDTEPVPDIPSSSGKSRQASKSTPRKASTNERSASKPRTASTSQGTPSKTESRPRTATRPEEPAPWLADMYKPDPLLPPDQQMLPTHARRIAQEQMERDRIERDRIDRDRIDREQREYAQIAREREQIAKATAAEKPRSPKPSKGSSEQQQEYREKKHTQDYFLSPTPNGERPEPARSPVSEHGGYSTMPKVSGSPAITSQSFRMQQPLHLPDTEVAEQKKKGCGCCVVM